MKNLSQFVAYFMKYVGIVGILLSGLGLFVSNQVGNSGEMLLLLFFVVISFIVFFIGRAWSKKLLMK